MIEVLTPPTARLLAPFQCRDCGMSFPSQPRARLHGERSGHFVEPQRCSCGVHLLGYVSVRAGYCTTCRRQMRARLDPEDMRGLPAALMSHGALLRARGWDSFAADVESEGRCIEQEVEDLTEHWAAPDSASCAHCGAPCSKRAKTDDAGCPVCLCRLGSGTPHPDYSEVRAAYD